MPDLTLESALINKKNMHLIAGIDEAGRGAIAGPVMAAAVILPLNKPHKIELLTGVDDSKRLSPKKRAAFYDIIIENVVAWGVGSVPATSIDKIGIIPATRQAMTLAVEQLNSLPDFLLVDGRIKLDIYAGRQQSIIHGDSKSLSIAAASILAKVSRDRYMIELDKTAPMYGLAQHKGYGTCRHKAALIKHGPALWHRHSFAPIRQP